jgi:hypothetical protein
MVVTLLKLQIWIFFVICLVSGQTPYTTICQKEKPKGYLPFICLKYCEIADQDCHLGGADHQAECTQEEAAYYIEIRKCTLQACNDYLENCVYDENEYCLSPACASFCNYYPDNNENTEIEIDCASETYLYMLKACQDTITDTKTINIDNEDSENPDTKSPEEPNNDNDILKDNVTDTTDNNNQPEEILNPIIDQTNIKLPVEQEPSENNNDETESSPVEPTLETDISTESPSITEINPIPKAPKPDQTHTHSSSSHSYVDKDKENLIEHEIDNSNYRDTSNHNIFSSISVSGIVYGLFFICNCFLIMMIMNNSRKIAKLKKKVQLLKKQNTD